MLLLLLLLLVVFFVLRLGDADDHSAVLERFDGVVVVLLRRHFDVGGGGFGLGLVP